MKSCEQLGKNKNINEVICRVRIAIHKLRSLSLFKVIGYESKAVSSLSRLDNFPFVEPS